MAIDLVDPLDYLILGALPEEGSLVLGVYPDGAEAKTLANETLKGAVDSAIVGRRLGAMRMEGLVTSKKAPKTNAGQVWQRTKQGKKVYSNWVSTQADSSLKEASGDEQ